MLARLCLALAVSLAGAASHAQDTSDPTSPAPQVLIIDSEALFLGSAYGQALQAEVEEAARQLQAENDRIQAQLVEEEQSLTALRATMPIEEFRAQAEAFDTKVQEIRRARDAKIAEIERAPQAAREEFGRNVRGIIGRLMLDRGAVVVLDRRTVFLALGSIDITQEAIARIDAEIVLNGEAPADPLPAPDQPIILPETDDPDGEDADSPAVELPMLDE